MRFCSINIFSGEQVDGNRKKELTKMFRNDSDRVVDAYLKSFKYYNNENCISLNISCDEEIDKVFIEQFLEGYPILHVPFNLNDYIKIKEKDKNAYWLGIVRNSIEYVCGIWSWERSFFEDVYSKCLIQLKDQV